MKRMLIVILGLLMCKNVFAADYYRGRTIIGVGVYSTGSNSILLIDVDGDKSGLPACAATKRFAISSTAPHYKEVMSLAMTAYAKQDNTVDIRVLNSCGYFVNAADILGIKTGVMPF
ncbi:hypothetical protein HG263_17515 [Pseudoalteromonas sp. JBTF-M23]|uniref:Uncharacterized protein n=1 Tax=Pseudoalteromonas caenipelagi TaxID=2726988 RepID=A0A849VI00_9GAMM|nr:hypothetical protein [Pseudoalteromonas caenipelagi]NOU52328.1 hypothetical protein [Pseudoalteromonas caenipelagi]